MIYYSVQNTVKSHKVNHLAPPQLHVLLKKFSVLGFIQFTVFQSQKYLTGKVQNPGQSHYKSIYLPSLCLVLISFSLRDQFLISSKLDASRGKMKKFIYQRQAFPNRFQRIKGKNSFNTKQKKCYKSTQAYIYPEIVFFKVWFQEETFSFQWLCIVKEKPIYSC